MSDLNLWFHRNADVIELLERDLRVHGAPAIERQFYENLAHALGVIAARARGKVLENPGAHAIDTLGTLIISALKVAIIVGEEESTEPAGHRTLKMLNRLVTQDLRALRMLLEHHDDREDELCYEQPHLRVLEDKTREELLRMICRQDIGREEELEEDIVEIRIGKRLAFRGELPEESLVGRCEELTALLRGPATHLLTAEEQYKRLVDLTQWAGYSTEVVRTVQAALHDERAKDESAEDEDRPPSPGEVIRSKLDADPLLTKEDLAAGLFLSVTHVRGLIADQVRIDKSTATRLAIFFGNETADWLELQEEYTDWVRMNLEINAAHVELGTFDEDKPGGAEEASTLGFYPPRPFDDH